MFKKLEGDTAVIVHYGVYRQSELYEWDGKLFVKFGSGYVRIRENGTTTKDGVWLEHLQIERPLYADVFGRLTIVNENNYRLATLKNN